MVSCIGSPFLAEVPARCILAREGVEGQGESGASGTWEECHGLAPWSVTFAATGNAGKPFFFSGSL